MKISITSHYMKAFWSFILILYDFNKFNVKTRSSPMRYPPSFFGFQAFFISLYQFGAKAMAVILVSVNLLSYPHCHLTRANQLQTAIALRPKFEIFFPSLIWTYEQWQLVGGQLSRAGSSDLKTGQQIRA